MRQLLVVCGMAQEARIVRGPAVHIVLSGGDARLLLQRLEQESGPAAAVISFGLAGGLHPVCKPGDVVIASEIRGADWTSGNAAGAAQALSKRLRSHGLPAAPGPIAGSDTPLLTPAAKAALYAATGALAVDMESHIAAAYAAERGLPFLAIRAICDPAERAVPEIAARALKPDGGTDLALILRGLARRPALLPELLRLGRDANAAFRSLRRVADLLGIGRGGADLVELLRDVA